MSNIIIIIWYIDYDNKSIHDDDDDVDDDDDDDDDDNHFDSNYNNDNDYYDNDEHRCQDITEGKEIENKDDIRYDINHLLY